VLDFFSPHRLQFTAVGIGTPQNSKVMLFKQNSLYMQQRVQILTQTMNCEGTSEALEHIIFTQHFFFFLLNE